MKTTSRAPPPFDISRSAVFGIGIGVPVAACLAVGGPALALFAGVGAISCPVAVALAIVAAGSLEATHPLWAAVAALFVMHPDPDRSMRCIAQRIAGTFAGVAIAWAVVHSIDSPWMLVALATGAAALMPWGMLRGLFFMTTIATVFLLLLFDVGMISQGGDRPLIFARLWDTLIGTAAVAIATLSLSVWRRGRPPPERARDTPEPTEPEDAATIEPGAHL